MDGYDNLRGNTGNDSLRGGDKGDQIQPDEGADMIRAGAGRDFIHLIMDPLEPGDEVEGAVDKVFCGTGTDVIFYGGMTGDPSDVTVGHGLDDRLTG